MYGFCACVDGPLKGGITRIAGCRQGPRSEPGREPVSPNLRENERSRWILPRAWETIWRSHRAICGIQWASVPCQPHSDFGHIVYTSFTSRQSAIVHSSPMQTQISDYMTVPNDRASNPQESLPPDASDKDMTQSKDTSGTSEFPQSDRMVSRVPQDQVDHSLALAKAAVQAAAENRGQQIVLLDLTGQTSLFDFFVIASGSSRRQLVAMSTEIDRLMKEKFDERRASLSGNEEGRWIVMDYGTIVVHLFDEDTRAFYDLESLWADSKSVDISEIVEAASARMSRFGS